MSRVFQAYQIIRQAATILVAVLLARSGIGITEVGQYEQLVFAGYTLSFFWFNAGLQAFVARYGQIPTEHRSSFTIRVTGLLAGMGMLVFGLALAGLYVLPSWSVLHGIPLYRWAWFTLFYLPWLVSSLIEHIYLVREDVRGLIRWTVFSSTGFVASLIMPILMTGHLDSGLAGLAIYGGFRLVWLVRLVFPGRVSGVVPPQLGEWWRTALPLMGYTLAGGAAIAIDSWIIESTFHDDRTFAIFRYGARELPFSLAVAGGLGTASLATLTRSWTTGLLDMKSRILRLCHWLFPVTLVLMLVSTPAYKFVFGPEYTSSASIFRIYLLLLASRLILTGPLLTVRGYTRAIFRVGMAELVLNAALSLWFVHLWGMEGVAWATVIAYIFERILHVIILRRRMGLILKDFIPVRTLTVYIGLLLVSFMAAGLLESVW